MGTVYKSFYLLTYRSETGLERFQNGNHIQTLMMKCIKKYKLKTKSTIWLLFCENGMQDSTDIPSLQQHSIVSHKTCHFNFWR